MKKAISVSFWATMDDLKMAKIRVFVSLGKGPERNGPFFFLSLHFVFGGRCRCRVMFPGVYRCESGQSPKLYLKVKLSDEVDAKMPIRRFMKGSGITQKPWVEITDPQTEEELQAVHALFEGAGTLKGKIGDCEASARRLLDDGEIPPAGNCPGEEQSLKWYAWNILNDLRFLRKAVEEEEAERAACLGLELGALIREAEIKFKWERHAERGKSQFDRLQQQNQDRNARAVLRAESKTREWNNLAEELIKEFPQFANNKSRIATLIEERTGDNHNTIRLKLDF